jgi:hypothetical protein
MCGTMARKDFLKDAGEWVQKLDALAQENRLPAARASSGRAVRGGDEIATDQLAAFGQLLVVLARFLDESQQTVARLTWAIAFLTVVLVADVLWRILGH